MSAPQKLCFLTGNTYDTGRFREAVSAGPSPGEERPGAGSRVPAVPKMSLRSPTDTARLNRGASGQPQAPAAARPSRRAGQGDEEPRGRLNSACPRTGPCRQLPRCTPGLAAGPAPAHSFRPRAAVPAAPLAQHSPPAAGQPRARPRSVTLCRGLRVTPARLRRTGLPSLKMDALRLSRT